MMNILTNSLLVLLVVFETSTGFSLVQQNSHSKPQSLSSGPPALSSTTQLFSYSSSLVYDRNRNRNYDTYDNTRYNTDNYLSRSSDRYNSNRYNNDWDYNSNQYNRNWNGDTFYSGSSSSNSNRYGSLGPLTGSTSSYLQSDMYANQAANQRYDDYNYRRGSTYGSYNNNNNMYGMSRYNDNDSYYGNNYGTNSNYYNAGLRRRTNNYNYDYSNTYGTSNNNYVMNDRYNSYNSNNNYNYGSSYSNSNANRRRSFINSPNGNPYGSSNYYSTYGYSNDRLSYNNNRYY